LSKAYPYIAKRLLTDPAPELRSSLKNLLFRDDEFRWNRLENLLRNAKGSREYDLGRSLDQAIEYLFSDRGTDLRLKLADELVRVLDNFGQNMVENVRFGLAQRLGFSVAERPIATENDRVMGHVQAIWGILRETEGVDPNQLLPILPKLLFKPEVQALGQQVANGVAQRALTRFIREVLVREDATTASLLKP
jgi:hypothetical protein